MTSIASRWLFHGNPGKCNERPNDEENLTKHLVGISRFIFVVSIASQIGDFVKYRSGKTVGAISHV
ncbi:hypothetical protein J8340_22665 [Escherichia coli]|uniref:Uncharacterized protein n=1 Tax=Brevibacillus fulvus TaxID=1125967 RepID=A0A938XVY8_9BACL|nr:hypothetical protein [Brevibacillus fulvus]MBP2898808.1 hypothetical protein [Escherichia coli]OJH16007.1 hypothetical protein BLX88_25950 [Bacillus obstructivus]